MKTLTKTLSAAVLAVVLLTSSSAVSLAADNVAVTKPVTGFNKIWVGGNVKIVLTQSDKEGITVGDNFDASRTSLIRKGQTLFINSVEGRQVTIKVSVKDLQRIEALGSAIVTTTNNFDVKCLQVFLSQNAKAKVKTTTGSLYTVINDDAVLKMNGAAGQHTLIASNKANLKLDKFVSIKTDTVSSDLVVANRTRNSK